MQNKQFLIYDGVLFASDAMLLRTANMAFRYGDGLFETMHFHKGSVLLFNHHYERLVRAMSVKRLSVKGFVQHSLLHGMIAGLVVKNRIFGDAAIRLSVFRKETAVFGEVSLQASWIAEASPLPEQGFQLNEKGIRLCVYSEIPRHVSPLSPFCTLSAEPYTLAHLYASSAGVDECLIVNGAGKITETACSNIFWIREGTVYTPKIASGCIDGIVRRTVLNLLQDNGTKTVETEGATLPELYSASELFLTDTIHGIRWVAGIGEKRYYYRETKRIHRLLCSHVFS